MKKREEVCELRKAAEHSENQGRHTAFCFRNLNSRGTSHCDCSNLFNSRRSSNDPVVFTCCELRQSAAGRFAARSGVGEQASQHFRRKRSCRLNQKAGKTHPADHKHTHRRSVEQPEALVAHAGWMPWPAVAAAAVQRVRWRMRLPARCPCWWLLWWSGLGRTCRLSEGERRQAF